MTLAIERLQQEADAAWKRVEEHRRRFEAAKDEWTNLVCEVSKAKRAAEIQEAIKNAFEEKEGK